MVHVTVLSPGIYLCAYGLGLTLCAVFIRSTPASGTGAQATLMHNSSCASVIMHSSTSSHCIPFPGISMNAACEEILQPRCRARTIGRR